MITKEAYEEARETIQECEKVTRAYHVEQAKEFRDRILNNPVFEEDELVYSACMRCPCGHGMAYPKGCGPNYHWDCSAVLKGIADQDRVHTPKLPFAFYKVKEESPERGTTRGKKDK